MRYIIIIMLVAFTASAQVRYELSCREDLLNDSYLCLLSQVGVMEATGNNDGPKIAEYLASVGLRGRYPYCAAGQYYCFWLPCTTYGWSLDLVPIPRSASVAAIYAWSARHGRRTAYMPRMHDLIAWKQKGKSAGHIERIITIESRGWVTTVGFNTSGPVGDQREGHGVMKKRRNILQPIGRLQIKGLIGFSTYRD